MTQFRPLGDRVLISLATPLEKSKGGIYIPPSAQEKNSTGTVVAVGPGRVTDDGRMIECRVKKGDTVMYSKYSGTEIEWNGAPHMIMREEDLVGILDDADSR